MKSQQVNFYILPEEQRWFEAQLRPLGNFVVAKAEAPTATLVLSESTVVRSMGDEALRVYLIRYEDVSRVRMRHVPEREAYIIDEVHSPVVEFSRCYFDGVRVRRGRLYTIGRYYDHNSVSVAKPKEFLDWANALMATVRRILVRDSHGDFLTRAAKERADRGEIALSIL